VNLNVNVLLVLVNFLYLELPIRLIPPIKPINVNKCYAISKYFFYHAMTRHFTLLM